MTSAPETSDREQRLVFDEVAEIYDRVRPGYPEQLALEVRELARLSPDDRILEVGCGTGQATRLFAPHGYRMMCLEPGAGMAAVARSNLAAFPDVELVETSFEDWQGEGAAFALLISAQAFHWVEPEVRFVKAARALRRGGAIALFWNVPLVGEDPVHRAIQEQYARYAPHLLPEARARRPAYARAADDLRSSGLFEEISQRAYPWRCTYDARTYAALMGTHSDHRLLSEADREVLHGGIRAAIESRGGEVKVQHVAVLLFARLAGW